MFASLIRFVLRRCSEELGSLNIRSLNSRGRNDCFKSGAEPATRPRRNRRAMRAGPWMPQKSADLVRCLGRQDVLELASLLLDFGFAVHGEAVGEETLGQPVPSNDAGCAFASTCCQFDDQGTVAQRG